MPWGNAPSRKPAGWARSPGCESCSRLPDPEYWSARSLDDPAGRRAYRPAHPCRPVLGSAGCDVQTWMGQRTTMRFGAVKAELVTPSACTR